jgi:hypothetical protein
VTSPTIKALYNSPKYPSTWTLKTQRELESMAKEFFDMLASGVQYNVFYAVKMMVGQETALQLARNGQMKFPRNL